MRLVTFRGAHTYRAGVAIDDQVVDAGRAAAKAALDGSATIDWTSVRSILHGGPEALTALAQAADMSRDEALDATQLHLGPPVPDPRKVICLGLNYRDHA